MSGYQAKEPWDARVVGLGGWMLSAHHSFDPASGVVRLGNGQEIQAFPAGRDSAVTRDRVLVASKEGSEVYQFDDAGRHTRTYNALTGAVALTFEYDTAGRLSLIRNGDGGVTAVERDESGLPVAIVAPLGHRTGLAVDDNGYLSVVAAPAGAVTRLESSPEGLLLGYAEPEAESWQFEYSDDGLLVRVADPAGRVKTYARRATSSGYVITVSDSAEAPTSYTFSRSADGTQRRTVVADAGAATALTIAPDGALLSEYPDGRRVTIQFGPDPRWGPQSPVVTELAMTTPSGIKTTVTSAREATLTDPNDPLRLGDLKEEIIVNGKTFLYEYRADPRTLTLSTPAGRRAAATIDDQGRVVDYTPIGGLGRMRYEYDEAGRPVSISQATGEEPRTTRLAYDDTTGTVEVTDALGQTSGLRFDAGGRLTEYKNTDGGVVRLDFDTRGNLTALTPPGGQPHVFRYNEAGLQIEYVPPQVDPAGGGVAHSYDSNGRLVQVAHADGRGIHVAYDGAGRAVGVSLEGDTLTARYDSASGLLASVARSNGAEVTYTYDGARLIGKRWSGPVSGGVGVIYGLDSPAIGLSINNAAPVSYEYDPDGLITRAGPMRVVRDSASGRVVKTEIGGLSTTWRYNETGEAQSATASFGGTTFYAVEYELDQLGRISRKTETTAGNRHAFEYQYDRVGRLIGVARDGRVTHQYDYDANGNRLSEWTRGGRIDATYDAQDRLLTYGGAKYVYASDGTLAAKSTAAGTTRYEYDALGNLLAAEQPGGRRIGYLVDGANRRLAKSIDGTVVQAFLYQDGLRPIAELDAAGHVVARFVYSTDRNVPDYIMKGGLLYGVITDAVGSPRLIVDVASGAVAQRLEYDAFGNVTTDTRAGFQPFGFAGGLYDPDLELVRFGARDYDSDSGRWTAKDPSGFAAGDANLYAYVANDPVNGRDPSGFEPFRLHDAFGLDVGANLVIVGGARFGLNLMWFPESGPAVYWYQTPHDDMAAGFNVGVGAELVWAQGSGPWDGLFNGVNLGGGPVSGSVFESDANGRMFDFWEGGWRGISFGVASGAKAGVAWGPTDYTCIPHTGCPGSEGDPHVTTANGFHYDFQAAGEFVALKSTKDAFEVQVRQEPWRGSDVVSVNTAVAVNLSGNRIGVYADETSRLRVDGNSVEDAQLPLTLDGGHIDCGEASCNSVALTLPDLSQVRIRRMAAGYLDVQIALAAQRADRNVGLFGGDGNESLAARDGSVIDIRGPDRRARYDALYGAFGESWRVRQAESLFDYGRGESTETYTLRDFPARWTSLQDLDPSGRQRAEAICRQKGVAQQPFLDDCILDVGITDEAAFADGAAWGQADAAALFERNVDSEPENVTSAVKYMEFSDLSAFTLNGSAATLNESPVVVNGHSVLRLTDGLNQGGSAFLKEPIRLVDGSFDASFSTYFQFQISDPVGISDGVQGADGIVFVIQTQSDTVGGMGLGMGYAGIPRSIGVEFDTWNNGAPDRNNGNHVGINVNGDTNSLAVAEVPTPMNNGQVWHAWIDYDGAGELLELRISQDQERPAEPVLSRHLDLAPILEQPNAYLGFTSGTGAAGNAHDIRAWEFRNRLAPVGEAPRKN